jgi:calcium binding protein
MVGGGWLCSAPRPEVGEEGRGGSGMSEELDWDRIAAEPDRERRLDSILADAYGESEQLWAFYTYWEEHAEFPFEAVPRSEVLSVDDDGIDTMPDAEALEVVKVSDATGTRGVLCQVMRGDKVRQMPIGDLVPLDPHNRRIWGDYVAWADSALAGGGMAVEEELDEEEQEESLDDEDEE